jgi:NTE family protein
VVLSAGYFGFFAHAGFLQALEEAGIAPSCWAGTSAGALVGAMAAAGMSSAKILQRLSAIRRAEFWDPDVLGLLARAPFGHAATGLLKGDRLRAMLTRELPARFEDLRKPLVVVAANLSRSAPEVFAKGPLAAAVHASCAYPGMFRAAEVGGELFWDGGLVDKAPALALHRACAPEAILVHFLPSHPEKPPQGFAAYVRAMSAGMDALRRDHFEIQVELLRAKGIEVHLISTEVAQLGPDKLDQGPDVAQVARRKVAKTLASFFTGCGPGE